MTEDKIEKQEEEQKVNKDTPAVQQGTFSTTRQVGDFRVATKIASPGSN